MTAFTFTVTLSRVTTSCAGTSSVSMRSDTRTIRSTGANTKTSPGPFGSFSNRPSRKITPRSYSRRILIEFSSQIATMITKTNSAGLKSFIVVSLPRGFYRQFQPVDGGYPHACTRSHRVHGYRVPILAVDEHLALGLQCGQRLADLPDHALAPALHLIAPRARRNGQQEHRDGRKGKSHG